MDNAHFLEMLLTVLVVIATAGSVIGLVVSFF